MGATTLCKTALSMTFSITRFRIMTLSINDTMLFCRYAECGLLFIVMLSVVTPTFLPSISDAKKVFNDADAATLTLETLKRRIRRLISFSAKF